MKTLKLLCLLLLPMSAMADAPVPECLKNLGTIKEVLISAMGITDTDSKDVAARKISSQKELFLDIVGKAITKECLEKPTNIKAFNEFMDTQSEIQINLTLASDEIAEVHIKQESLAPFLIFPTTVIVVTGPDRFTVGNAVPVENINTQVPPTCSDYWYKNISYAHVKVRKETPVAIAAKARLIDQTGGVFALLQPAAYKGIPGQLIQVDNFLAYAVTHTNYSDKNYYRQRAAVRSFASALRDSSGCGGHDIAIYIGYSKNNDKEFVIADGPFIVP